MQTNDLKNLVKEKYGQIASQDKERNLASCCGSTGCGDVYSIMAEDYNQLEGYNPDADLGLGCGLPTEFAAIKPGDTVVDLGSGAGNDCFVARRLTGASGKVIGIDFTEAMIEKARSNAEKVGFNNVEFRFGDIEKMPLTSNVADVVISNCVLNLVPDKQKVFAEIFRVLKPGAHFSISDIVLEKELPQGLLQAAEMYAGCIAGAINKNQYLEIIANAGFTDITVQKEKQIQVPEEILADYLDADAIKNAKASGLGIASITVYAKKPVCEPGKGCC